MSYPQVSAELGQPLKREAEPLVLVALGDRILGLTADEFVRALERGSQQLPAKPTEAVGTAPDREPLLTADQAAELASVPKQWLLEAARQKRIPHFRLGKYVRFSAGEIREATREVRRGASRGKHLEAVK